MLLCAAFGEWPSLHGQFLLWCHPEAVAKAYWSSSDTTNDVDTCFDCRGSREGAQGDVFLLRATLPAEDEVLVTAAGKNGDGEALRRKASCEAGHRVWLHCIILVLEALALSPQSFAKSRAGAVFARVSTPSYNMPVAKAECLRLLECQVREFCRHWDDCVVIVDSENRQVAYDGAW